MPVATRSTINTGESLKELARQPSIYNADSLRQAVRAARSRASMTQTKLAGKVGVNASAISRIECGRDNGSRKLLVRIADELGVKVSEWEVMLELHRNFKPPEIRIGVELGDMLRELREGRDMTRPGLAKASGVNSKHIQQIEDHEVGASLETIQKLATALKPEDSVRTKLLSLATAKGRHLARVKETQNEVGKIVRQLRITAGFTQQKLAGLMGVSQAHIMRIELHRNSIYREEFDKLVHILNPNSTLRARLEGCVIQDVEPEEKQSGDGKMPFPVLKRAE